MTTIIKNGTIVTGDLSYKADVRIENDVITENGQGQSHNKAEAISPEWAAAGTDVLLHAVLEVAEVVS